MAPAPGIRRRCAGRPGLRSRHWGRRRRGPSPGTSPGPSNRLPSCLRWPYPTVPAGLRRPTGPACPVRAPLTCDNVGPGTYVHPWACGSAERIGPIGRTDRLIIVVEEIEQPEEQLPPVGAVRVVYLGPVAPHWEVQSTYGEAEVVDPFRDRTLARLTLLPPHDQQFRRNRERVVRDAERERLELEWDLGIPEEEEVASA